MFENFTSLGRVDDKAVRAWGDELQQCKDVVLELRAQIHERTESLSRGVEVARLSAIIRRKISSLREALNGLERKVPNLNMPAGEATRRTDEVTRLKREVNHLEDAMRRSAGSDSSHRDISSSGPFNSRPHTTGGGSMADAMRSMNTGRQQGAASSRSSSVNTDFTDLSALTGMKFSGSMETDRTADKSNSELVTLQRTMMNEQDAQLADLSKHINSLKHISNAVSEELDTHNKMLTDLEHDMESTHAKIRKAETKMTDLSNDSTCTIC
mmetsp:Transcript_24092/g.29179  ORF Transcript_24092/g.29179 Transcript_24092/m.29179 type:complete len:269 (+) Transcript_24092:291-1097(+)|eukprot:CAMPEP_0197849398 /NCGR_PEP_ID=MMETSP1438-20131217/11902_1 /TAXON_ID=1461541 /ORGANISM="Pterosperma sp., Strain CCMP1384" /LENGTH=268 /DNA_ID=CAMNT_0043462061 /DNA_START=286 /DNA_END=1092 /DNA_ORIENTATION=-